MKKDSDSSTSDPEGEKEPNPQNSRCSDDDYMASVVMESVDLQMD